MNTTRGYQTLVEHFRKQGWRFEAVDERRLLHCSFGMRNGSFRAVAVVDESDDLFQFYTFLPMVVPPDKRTAVAELCMRISYMFKLGNFELDFQEGNVRLHTSVAYPKGDLADEVIRRAVGTNLFTMDAHFPAFMSVLYAGRPPREALARVACVRTVSSYRLIVDSQYYACRDYFWVPRALATFDLPDLAALIAPRRVAWIDPVNAMLEPIEPEPYRNLGTAIVLEFVTGELLTSKRHRTHLEH